MAKYTLQNIGGLESYADIIENNRKTRCNINLGLRTPAGYTMLAFDPHGYDIKNMTIAELEKLAIEIFQKKVGN